jgi:hypothetical protein
MFRFSDYHCGRIDKFGNETPEAFFERAQAVCECQAFNASTGLALTNHARYCPVYDFLPTCEICDMRHFAEFCTTCTLCRRQGSHDPFCDRR